MVSFLIHNSNTSNNSNSSSCKRQCKFTSGLAVFLVVVIGLVAVYQGILFGSINIIYSSSSLSLSSSLSGLDFLDQHHAVMSNNTTPKKKETNPTLQQAAKANSTSSTNEIADLPREDSTSSSSTESIPAAAFPSSTTTKTTSTTKHYYNRTLTLVASLRGEMGNNLGVLALSRLTKLLVEKELPGAAVHIVGEHQASTRKWKAAQQDLQECFVNLRDLDFEGGRHDSTGAFATVQQQQHQWFQRLKSNSNNSSIRPSMLHNIVGTKKINFLKQLLDAQAARGDHSIAPQPIDGGGSTAKYSLPYLQTTGMASKEFLTSAGRYHDIRRYFRFDTVQCCPAVVTHADDEIVFHFRNFVAELRVLRNPGMVELSPADAARQLFANNNLTTTTTATKTNSSIKVVVIGRFRKKAGVLYAQALQQQGFEARYVQGQSGTQDFCLAMSTKNQLVGSNASTFVIWASILGSATINRWYGVHPKRRGSFRQQTLVYQTDDGRQFYEELHGREQVLTKDLLSTPSLSSQTEH